jgi:hypothetical protein
MALHVLYVGRGTQTQPSRNGEVQMLGWMMVFALMTILAMVRTIAGGASATFLSTKLAAFVFGLLFLASALLNIVRRRT